MSVYKRYQGKRITAKHPKYAKGTWYIYKRIRGQKPIHKSIPEARTREQAEEIERKLLDRQRERKYGLDDVSTTFSEFVDSVYIDYVYAKNVNTYVKEIFIRELKTYFGSMILSEITEQDCRSYQHLRMRTPTKHGGKRASASVNKEMTTLSKIFSLAKASKIVKENPVSGISKLKAPPARRRRLTPDQRTAFYIELEKDPLMFRIVLLASNLPLRRGQIMAIHPEDITGDWLMASESKGKPPRPVPLNPTAKAAISSLMADAQLPFPLRDFTKRWKRVMLNSGINKEDGTREDNFHFHDLRHEFGSGLMEKDVNPYIIQQLFDHSDMKTSSIYISASQDHLIDAVNRLEIQESEGIN